MVEPTNFRQIYLGHRHHALPRSLAVLGAKSYRYQDLLGYTKEDIEQHFADYIPQAANNLGISTDELWQLLERYYAGFCFDEDASVKV